MLTGFAENDLKGQSNFLSVERNTTDDKIEAKLLELLKRSDIGVILISQNIAERVRRTIELHTEFVPTILEIPAKDHLYEPEKDPIVLRAASLLWGPQTGLDKLLELKSAS